MIQELTAVQNHAIKLVVDGAVSHAEDAMNEDGQLSDGEHEQAVDLALSLARTIARYPHVLLELTDGA